MGVLPCSLPCQSSKEPESDSSYSNPTPLHSDSSSSSNSSLSSQFSLPSVPSLNPSFQNAHQPSYAYHHCIATLKGSSSYVFSLTLAGKHLYTGGSNGEIRRWVKDPYGQDNLPKGGVVADAGSAVKSIVVLGDKLFTAHHDHKIRIWKIDEKTPNEKFKCIATLPILNDRCMTLFSAKNYVEVRRHKKCTWVHHVDTVSALALSKDCSFLYSVSWDRTLKIWRTSDFKCLESVWNAHDDAINAIAVSDEGFIYTGSADKKIKVWRKQGGEKKHTEVATLERHKSAVNSLALSTDGSLLYSGACDRSIIVWEKDGGGGHMVVAGALRGHTKAILCLAVVSDLVCSGSADKSVRVWKRGNGKSFTCLCVFEGHKSPVKCLSAAVNNSDAENNSGSGTNYVVYSGSLDCDIKVWQINVPFAA